MKQIKIYIDLCALKRPFDDQRQGRIWIETQAVIRILEAIHNEELEALNSDALVFENGRNPNAIRRHRISAILNRFGTVTVAHRRLLRRAEGIRVRGIPDMDAWHLASAEEGQAQYYITCDDLLLTWSERIGLALCVINPTDFVRRGMR